MPVNDVEESEVLYYVETDARDTTTGDTDDGIDQTRVYLERNRAAGVVTYSVVNVIEVTIDHGTDFNHIHYGLWNGLSGTDDNEVSGLGIGFVQNHSGSGMTATDDMPNIGSATYSGNWVANVQEADRDGDGDITRMEGEASMVANFDKNDVDVELTDFVMLENGEIDGNTFAGTKASLIDMVVDDPDSLDTTGGIQTDSGLATDGKFDGSFEGAFFGPRAAEAGGVFSFSTDDNEDGAFTGSFGGAR